MLSTTDAHSMCAHFCISLEVNFQDLEDITGMSKDCLLLPPRAVSSTLLSIRLRSQLESNVSFYPTASIGQATLTKGVTFLSKHKSIVAFTEN